MKGARKRKLVSAEPLRQALIAWLTERGGTEKTPASASGILAATWHLPLRAGGALLVHLPEDDDLGTGFSIRTRFTDGARLPTDANQYSRKWNIECVSDMGHLFSVFTRRVQNYELLTAALFKEE